MEKLKTAGGGLGGVLTMSTDKQETVLKIVILLSAAVLCNNYIF